MIGGGHCHPLAGKHKTQETHEESQPLVYDKAAKRKASVWRMADIDVMMVVTMMMMRMMIIMTMIRRIVLRMMIRIIMLIVIMMNKKKKKMMMRVRG
jgi:hypothetical protein